MLLPSHCLNINLTAVQQSPFDASRLPLILIIHCVNIHALESTKRSVKLQTFHFSPNHQYIIRMQRYSIRDRPKEGERNHTWLARHRVRRRWHSEDRIRDEKISLPVEQQRSREMAACHDCGDSGVFVCDWDVCVWIGEESDVSSGCIGPLEPLLVRGTDVCWALERRSRPLRPCAVVVWVGDDDGFETAETVDLVDCSLVEEWNQIPEDVAVGCLDQFCAVADGEFEFGSD